VEAINDHLGADYSEKYRLSACIEYNAEKCAPNTTIHAMSRSDGKHFDRSKGYGGKRFSQAVFGFSKSLLASAKLRQGGSRVDSHLFPLFGITRYPGYRGSSGWYKAY
jgi:hypothetical protein